MGGFQGIIAAPRATEVKNSGVAATLSATNPSQRNSQSIFELRKLNKLILQKL